MANRFGMDYNNTNSGGGGNYQWNNGANDAFSPGGGGGDGGSNNPTSSPDPNRRKATEEKTLIPVTTRQILNCTQENTLPDGREPHQIKLVGAVRNVNAQSTSYTYDIEDGTGLIEVKEWVDTEENPYLTQMRQEIANEDGLYVRIIGKLTTYEGKTTVVAQSIRKLNSGNELTYHMLEVVHSSEKYKRGNQIVGAPNMSMTMNGVGMGMTMNTPMKENGGDDANRNDALKNDIIEFMSAQDPTANDGQGPCILEFIKGNKNYNEAQVRAKLTEMEGDGRIYTTTDENHYNMAFD